MRTTGRARRGTRATTACRWRQRVVPRDAGHRGQRVLSRLSGRERGTFASRLVQFAITRVAVPRRANGPDPEPPLGVHEHESSGDRREGCEIDDYGLLVVEGTVRGGAGEIVPTTGCPQGEAVAESGAG